MLVVTLWTGVAICVRMLEGRVPISDLSFYRGLLSVAVMMPLIRRAGRLGHGGPLRKALPWFALRGIFIFTAQTCFYFALTWMPIVEATVLSGTTPIFLALLAGMFLGEKVSPVRWAAIGMGFAGIVVILRPGAEAIQIAALTALASAVLFASSSAMNKYLSRTEPASRIVGWTNLMIAAAAAIPFVYNSYVPQWSDLPWIAVIAMLGTGAQYGLARAIAAADASFSGPFDFLARALRGDRRFDPVQRMAGYLGLGRHRHRLRQHLRPDPRPRPVPPPHGGVVGVGGGAEGHAGSSHYRM